MPRKPREESRTKIYHVMSRGLNKLAIFNQSRERTRLINLIRENLSKYDVAIYAYCIMPNHFHLLIKADLEELASFMAKILAAFAKYYNFKHNRIGYVFQDRFKSQCVEDEKYFWNCLRYIHMNPAKTGKIEEIFQYEHSSMKEFYYEKQDILSEEIFKWSNEKFANIQEFLEFHEKGSWDVFADVSEDMMKNNCRIAREILSQCERKYRLAGVEILDYVATRGEYEKRLKEILKIPQWEVKKIEEIIRKELAGTG